MSPLEIVGGILLVVFLVWLIQAKPDPHAGQVHYLERPPLAEGTLFPPGCALIFIPIVLALGGYVIYLFWISKPF